MAEATAKRICPGCQATNVGPQSLCLRCGTALPAISSMSGAASRCWKCGAGLPSAQDVRFCVACGADQTQDPARPRLCVSCGGTLLGPDDAFCHRCGAPVKARLAARCMNPACGKPLAEGARFCAACGTPAAPLN